MTRLQMHDVDSTCVAKLGYDEVAEEALVEFHDSGLYGYRPVPPDVYAEFELAESKGTFLNEVIKPGYRVRRLGG
jgi:hypothetical protein